MIVAHVFALLGTSAVATTLPKLILEWHLSTVEAGWLSGAYFAGYACAVPVLVSLTDRYDARAIFLIGCVIGAVADYGFAAGARGLASGTWWWFLAGVSLAGVYMPGLRVIIDRVSAGLRVRAVPYYTASFGIGMSVSFFVAGSIAQDANWRLAFVAGSAGCGIAFLGALVATAGTKRTAPGAGASKAFDVRAVLRNRIVVRYILAYGGHCWELFALRAWLVTLLLFMWHRSFAIAPGNVLTYWSSGISLLGVPASIAGAEWALRMPRSKLVALVAWSSVGLALAVVVLGTLSFAGGAIALGVYSAAVLADSGAITAGVVEAADERVRGSTLAVHSLVGFIAGAAGPAAAGIALAAAGGLDAPFAWLIALAVMAAGSALAALVVPRSGLAPSTEGSPRTL
jgi:hypothetical protein